MLNTIIGTCGNCGGPVEVPHAWYATIPPTPTCRDCGATAKPSYGPTLPMDDAKAFKFPEIKAKSNA